MFRGPSSFGPLGQPRLAPAWTTGPAQVAGFAGTILMDETATPAVVALRGIARLRPSVRQATSIVTSSGPQGRSWVTASRPHAIEAPEEREGVAVPTCVNGAAAAAVICGTSPSLWTAQPRPSVGPSARVVLSSVRNAWGNAPAPSADEQLPTGNGNRRMVVQSGTQILRARPPSVSSPSTSLRPHRQCRLH